MNLPFDGFEITMFISQFICVLFYALFVEYPEGVKVNTSEATEPTVIASLKTYYPVWMDVHVLAFFGFGFFMVFLKNVGWTATGFTYILACWVLQITILCLGFWGNVVR